MCAWVALQDGPGSRGQNWFERYLEETHALWVDPDALSNCSEPVVLSGSHQYNCLCLHRHDMVLIYALYWTMGFDTGKKAHNSVGFFMGVIPVADHPRTEFIQIFSFRVNRHRGVNATPRRLPNKGINRILMT